MYLSFYILNTFFLILSAILMVFITETKNFLGNQSEKILIVAVSVFTIGISQFVIVPYDISSYFFLLVFFWFLIKYLEKNSTKNLIILITILAISTFNRESSALMISLAATLLYSKFGIKKESIFPVAILGISFLIIYLGMRFSQGTITTNDGNLFLQNFTDPKNLFGIIFWLVFFVFSLILAKDKASANRIWLFHFFAIPYLAMCFYTGIIYEIRLYVPLFLVSLLIGKLHLLKIE